MSRRDVAWGFFMFDIDDKRRVLESHHTLYRAKFWHAHYDRYYRKPGPIFRITPPKPKPKRGRKS